MKDINKKIITGAGILTGMLMTVGIASYVVAKKLVEVALDRKDKKEEANSEGLGKVISGTSISKEILQKQKEAGERLENRECEIVEIDAYDSEKLIGHWFPCKKAKRTIIAMHGWRSSWTKDFGMISEFWHNNDCNVLYAEQRAQNNSGGSHMGFGLIERYDCYEWIKWVDENTHDNIPIYLAGISMGATTVLMSAEFDLPKKVSGIIADCGFTSPHEIWKHVAEKNLHLFYDVFLENIANDICKRKIQMGTKEFSTIDAMKKCKVPVLFIHGGDDKFVPIEMTFRNYKECIASKRLLVVPGAEHAMSYAVETENYEKEILDFWKDFDRK